MDIITLIRDMTIVGFRYFMGSMHPLNGYSIRFIQKDGETKRNAIEFHKICKGNSIGYEIIAINSKEERNESGLLPVEKFYELYVEVVKIFGRPNFNFADLILKPSKN